MDKLMGVAAELSKMWKENIADNERNIELFNECIVEILLGKSMSLEDKDEVKKIVKEKYPKARIVECYYLNNTFEQFFF